MRRTSWSALLALGIVVAVFALAWAPLYADDSSVILPPNGGAPEVSQGVQTLTGVIVCAVEDLQWSAIHQAYFKDDAGLVYSLADGDRLANEGLHAKNRYLVTGEVLVQGQLRTLRVASFGPAPEGATPSASASPAPTPGMSPAPEPSATPAMPHHHGGPPTPDANGITHFPNGTVAFQCVHCKCNMNLLARAMSTEICGACKCKKISRLCLPNPGAWPGTTATPPSTGGSKGGPMPPFILPHPAQ